MNISVQDINDLKVKAAVSDKKFIRLKEGHIKGCFYQCTKQGIVTCIVRYEFRCANKVYKVAEVGKGLGQVSVGTAVSMATRIAKDILKGGDPQAEYKAMKHKKKLAENPHQRAKNKDDLYVAERAIAYYHFNTCIPTSKQKLRRALDEITLAFGDKRICDVTKQDVVDLLLNIEARGAGWGGKFSTAANVLKYGNAMWNWGLDMGGFESPNYFSTLKSFKRRYKGDDKERVLYLEGVKEMAEVHYSKFSKNYQRCVILQAYTAVRSMNITSAAPTKAGGSRYPICWSEFDLDKGTWLIKKERMKGRKRAHIIDLPSQLLSHLKLWHIEDGSPEKGLVIRSDDKPYGMLNSNAISKAYTRQGVEFRPHDWRTCIATELAEMKGCTIEMADLILSHYRKNTYIKTTKPEERKEWLQVWADKLDTLGFDNILERAQRESLDKKVIFDECA